MTFVRSLDSVRSLAWRAALSAALVALPTSVHAQTLAFPEAEGFGRFATGARTNLGAASVYHVTNLNDSGAGSLRDALSQSNRFVVFDVGGIINLSSVVTVASNITIAGQTAPGGIQVYGNRVAFHGANNLISRHWAVRMGSAPGRVDAASIVRGTNMIYDHMSITWGVDGTFDINPDTGQIIDEITIQNTIVGQGLDVVGHSTGGLMTLGDGNRISVIKSLYADNVTRNPKVRAENEFINNVVYGYETSGYIMGDTTATSHANVVGNYFIEGPVNGSSPFASGTSSFHIYAADNWVDDNRDGVLNGSLNSSYPGADVVAAPHAFPTTASMSAQDAVSYVIDNVGPKITRDAVDSRLVQEVASYGTLGGVIVRESDLFPNYGTNPQYLNVRSRLADNDNDGIADNWETAHGLSPANGADWKNLAGGYTQLENYVNEVGANGTTKTSTGGAWTSGAAWGGAVPTLADDAVVAAGFSHASGNAFARRAYLDGAGTVSGGTLDVFDTLSVGATGNSTLMVSGGSVAAGQVVLAAPGRTAALSVSNATLRTGVIASGGGTASLALTNATFRAGGAINVSVPTTLGGAGVTFDTAGNSGTISGAISGPGGFTKQGAGTLTLSGANSFTGPTEIQAGQLTVQGSGLGQTSGVKLENGTILNVAAVPGGLSLGAGKTLEGKGTVTGNVVAGAGAVVRPQGSLGVVTARAVGIQAENMVLGPDWSVFNNAVHGTGAGGSYSGSDLSGGGIILTANESLTSPVSTGIVSTTVNIPTSGTWHLFAKIATPSASPLAGDPSPAAGGNNSVYLSGSASILQTTTTLYDPMQTLGNPADAAAWTLVSTALSPQSGVYGPLDAGLDYSLTAGAKTFSFAGREIGTVVDGFVLSDSNLTLAQLNAALAGTTTFGTGQVMTIAGNYTHGTGATMAIDLAASDSLSRLDVTGAATLSGNLAVSLLGGFTPSAADSFTILTAGTLGGTFGNAGNGSRLSVADGSGSFIVNYDYASDRVTLSNFLTTTPGDFNLDGLVNAADLATWRSAYGVSAAGDANHDGLTDGNDFLIWQRYANSGGAFAAVPEPSELATLLVCLALSGVRACCTCWPKAKHALA